MRRIAPIAALLVLVVAPSREARADDMWGYFDILSPEMVGELGSHTYDLNQQVDKDNSRFLGNQTVSRGRFLGGGFGLRVLVGGGNGFFGGGEFMVAGGRMMNAELPWSSTSTALHYDVLTEVGYALSLKGLAALHVAAVFGFDGMRFDVAGPQSNIAAATIGNGTSMDPPSLTLSRMDLRAGLQVGLHVNLYKALAFFADGTIDYDGQYRIRMGLALGCPRDGSC